MHLNTLVAIEQGLGIPLLQTEITAHAILYEVIRYRVPIWLSTRTGLKRSGSFRSKKRGMKPHRKSNRKQ
jgi:hypothetical protein